ncbi:esterase/lipase family protein [Microbulbifer marinus]|uniref:Alpha/beta hydrolase family protein n=1 Tax=Microbulbifer marinus TaxID=658218 RepID=A0A1H3YU45_9GAMM|nr:alpha/beta fold hydrolase [Microbulbifer marinus]SEA15079.1 Alpha/beta hydrolase family protein [Microbulbifer marinus]
MPEAGSRRRTPPLLAAGIFLLFFSSAIAARADTQCVVLLHGLTKDSRSMLPLQRQLIDAGYYVANIDYPSRKKPIAELADLAVRAGLEQCARVNARPVNFITHSLGGLLVRHYFERHASPQVMRVVMLAPPNHGSRVGDILSCIPYIKDINGPAGRQLGTGAGSVPLQLGATDFDLGIITGNRSYNPLASTLLDGADDGRITVDSARLEGMCGFLVLPRTHGGIAADEQAIAQALQYLKQGYFSHPRAERFDCAAD